MNPISEIKFLWELQDHRYRNGMFVLNTRKDSEYPAVAGLISEINHGIPGVYIKVVGAVDSFFLRWRIFSSLAYGKYFSLKYYRHVSDIRFRLDGAEFYHRVEPRALRLEYDNGIRATVCAQWLPPLSADGIVNDTTRVDSITIRFASEKGNRYCVTHRFRRLLNTVRLESDDTDVEDYLRIGNRIAAEFCLLPPTSHYRIGSWGIDDTLLERHRYSNTPAHAVDAFSTFYCREFQGAEIEDIRMHPIPSDRITPCKAHPVNALEVLQSDPETGIVVCHQCRTRMKLSDFIKENGGVDGQ